jgi:hypothetical protein
MRSCALIGTAKLGPEWFALPRQIPERVHYKLCGFGGVWGAVAPDVVVRVEAWITSAEEQRKILNIR